MSSAPDAALERPHSVYRCYAGDVLLYVGVTADVAGRMFHHLHPCNRGKQPNGSLRRHMTHHESVEYGTKVEARAAERVAIATEAPLLNRQHNVKRFRKAAGGTYVALEPVHAITAAAFPEMPRSEAA